MEAKQRRSLGAAKESFEITNQQVFQKVLVIFIAWQGISTILHLITLSFSNMSSRADKWHAFPDNDFLDSFFRWDSGWYRTIIETGYSYQAGEQSNVAFFPLYPSLVALITHTFHCNLFIVGLLLSNACLLAALFFVYKISLLYLSREIANKVLILLLIFPVSFFYSTLYTESLYLLTISASFYFFIKEKYFLSGVWGGLASLTKVTGCLLLAAYGLELLIKYFQQREKPKKRSLYLLLIPCGLLGYMLFLQLRFGDPIAFIRVQSEWQRTDKIFPVITLLKNFKSTNFAFPRDHLNAFSFLNALFGTLFLAISCFGLKAKKFCPSLFIFVLLSLLLPLSTGSTTSILRYSLPMFPVFMYLGWLSQNNRIYHFLVFSFTYLLSALFLSFSNWGVVV